MLTLTPIVWTVRTDLAHEVYGRTQPPEAARGKHPIADQVELCRVLREMGFSAIEFERVRGRHVPLSARTA